MANMFEIKWDDEEVEKYLEPWQEKSVKKVLKAAAAAYGKAGKPILKAATPVGPSGNSYTTRGALQRAVGYKQIRSRYGIGVVIASFRKPFPFYRHMVTGGTKAHVILPRTAGGKLAILGGVASAVHHTGARPNPYVAGVAGAVQAAGFDAAEKVVFAGLDDARHISDTDTEG